MERYPELLRTLLINRGIKTPEEAEKFLYPDYVRDLHDPFLMLNMSRAADRILAAIEDNEKTVIYGDYDCDGIPGSTVLYEFFRKIGYENFFVYIPHRYDEGYGLHVGAVEQFARSGVELIITVDSGTTDIEAVARANEYSIDVIVTDHHVPHDILPPAHAILNPKQKDDDYPFDSLCGAGVAYKLVQALIARGSFEKVKGGWEKWLLDLVGLATIADMVPLVGENRALAHFGLLVLRKSLRPGILSLMRTARLAQDELTEDDVGFSIGPRLNAASRMDVPARAFDLLATTDHGRAMDLARHLEKMNTDRKYLIAEVMGEAEHLLSKKEHGSVLVVGSESWRPGVLGLAASRLAEKYKKTAFVWGGGSPESAGAENYKGSCRSDGTLSVIDLMQSAGEGVFSAFGGHEGAGGFSVPQGRIHVLEERLCLAYAKIDKRESRDVAPAVDAQLSLDDVTWDNYRYIEMLAPFGVGNPKPLFRFEDVAPVNIRQFGKSGEHLEIIFRRSDGSTLSAVKFFTSFQMREDGPPSLSLLAHIEKNTFKRPPELRLRIVEIV
jgi:single-stranded-DNA-specific exonuclease